MKFSYCFKTSDGVRHEGEYHAASRDVVYAELKAKGIRPFNVTPLPGFWNKVSGIRPGRLVIPVVLLAMVFVAVFLAIRSTRRGETIIAEANHIFLSPTRHQIIGDSAIIEAGLLSGWAEVFPEEGDRFLASFAVPGVLAAVPSTTVEAVEAALSRKIGIAPGDGVEAMQIKSIVEGMKDELRDYLAAGGSVKGYGDRLVERQEQEISFYRRVKNDVDAAVSARRPVSEIEALWRHGNAELRRMGIRLVALPGVLKKN